MIFAPSKVFSATGTTKISGSIPGTLTANVSADIGDLGRGCFNPAFSRNLISEDSVLKAG